MVTCGICKVNFVSIPLFKIHLVTHGGARFLCGEDNCGRSFDKTKDYFRHLRVTHNIVKGSVCTPGSSQENLFPPSNDLDDQCLENDVEAQGDALQCAPSIPDMSGADFRQCYSQSVEVLVSKLYKNPSIPRNFVQSLIDDINFFLTGGFIEILESKVVSALKSFHSSESSLNDITEMFKCMKNPFEGLDSDYKRMEYFQSNKFYVPPVPYTICESRPKQFRTKDGVKIKQVKTTGQFVPFRKVLTNLFELPGSLSATLKFVEFLTTTCPNDIICNTIQGDIWRRKISYYFNPSDIVFPIDFYFDDVEPNAALGPHSEKLGAGYIMLPVLPPACQSKLENIFVVLIIDSDDRKSCVPERTSYNAEVFKPVIHELNFLEKTGIVCKTPDLGEVRVYFVLNKVRGDNLGLHGVLGFSECFTANYLCTICKAPQWLTKRMTMEDPSLLRDPQNYDEDVALNDVSRTGIKEACVFNNVRSFHVTDNMCVDIMHDGAEGLSHYVLIAVLKHCIDCRYFTLHNLNSRLFFFDYGPADSSNKPVPISEDFASKKKLKGTARETMTLVRLLGVIVGDLVPENDKYWLLYNLHREIQEISLAKQLPRQVADELKLLIHEHHSLYIELVGDLPPKGHYYIHDPRIVKNSGPLVHSSSMRGEAKHRDLTKYCRAITSRRNLPKSCAIKHQLTMCFRFVSQAPLLPPLICGPGEIISINDHVLFPCFQHKLPPSLSTEVQLVNWAEVDGTMYKPSMVLVYGVCAETRFKFGKIVDIFISQGKVMFICQRLTNIGFHDHVGGFEVSLSKYYTCVSHDQLFDPFPLYDFALISGGKYIVLKHYL